MKKMILVLLVSFVSSHVMAAEPEPETQKIQRLRAQIAANRCPYAVCREGARDITARGAQNECYALVKGKEPSEGKGLFFFPTDKFMPGEMGECARLFDLHKKLRIAQHQNAERR